MFFCVLFVEECQRELPLHCDAADSINSIRGTELPLFTSPRTEAIATKQRSRHLMECRLDFGEKLTSRIVLIRSIATLRPAIDDVVMIKSKPEAKEEVDCGDPASF